MRQIKVKDLKEQLVPLYEVLTPTPTGGQVVTWEEGPQVWGVVDHQTGPDGYVVHPPGGGMASDQGSVKDWPGARYRVIILAPHDEGRSIKRLIWKSRRGDRLLEITRQPSLFQKQQYTLITTVEIPHDNT